VQDGPEHERPGVRGPRQCFRKRRPLRYHDWGFVIDVNEYLNKRNDSINKHGVDYDQHDKPDVEFNDDGSVHINTPGDYHFEYSYNDSLIAGWRRRNDNGGWTRTVWRDEHDPDDPALD
jgi:hypothetical protein